MRRLIINADDFGLTSGVNRAIVEAQDHGIVTSATLMANAGAFDEAAGMARSIAASGSIFSVGCHVVLLDGEPLLPANRVPSLLQSDAGNGGRLRESLNRFLVASFRHKLNSDEIEAEAMAQMERIQRPLLRAARARNITAVRNPFGQVWPLPLSSLLRTRQAWKRLAQLNVLRSFAVEFRREVTAHGLRTTDGSVGVLVTGVLDLKLFTAIVEAIPEGTWEFVTHPGYNDTDLDKVRTRLRRSREQELRLLTSPETKELLQRQGIELISYGEL